MALYLTIFLITLFVLYKFSGANFYMASDGRLSGENLNNVQDLFFRAVFTLLGYVAKRDGPVNEKEVKRTQTFMEKMDLDATQKREAIRLFKVGAEPKFNADGIIKEFYGLAKKSPNLAQILLVYLINLARVDGLLVAKEVDAVHQVALGLGYSNIMFKHLLQMVTSQNKYGDAIKNQKNNDQKNSTYNRPASDSKKSSDTKQNSSSQQNANYKSAQGSDKKTDSRFSQTKTNETKANNNAQNGEESCAEKTEDFNTRDDQLGAAYDVFDLSPSASDAEVKKAYRTLVNQYHPDKLMGQGLPPYMIQSATECFQTIQAAYDYIKEARAK